MSVIVKGMEMPNVCAYCFLDAGECNLHAEVNIWRERHPDCPLIELPPAQPGIIRCRECKFASGDSRICMQFGHSPIGELDFCAWAERRTDEA